MRIIDRYVLGSFLKNYLLSFAVLVGLFVVMDMIFNFDEFTDPGREVTARQIIEAIASYYFHQGFLVYTQLAGVIPVMAAAFTLLRMSRFNELTALLAAGVPMVRVAAPVIVTAVAINLIVQPINQEVVIPRMAHKIARDREQALDAGSRSFAVRAMPDGRGGVFDAARYHPAGGEEPAWVETLSVVERDGEGRVGRLVVAEIGRWDATAKAWRLEEGREVVDLARAAAPTTAPGSALAMGELAEGFANPSSDRPLDALATPVSPAEIELFRHANGGVGVGGSYFDLLSTADINALLSRPQQYATASLLRAKHLRLASHAMNVVLMLLAIPAVLTRQPGQLRQAAARTLVFVGLAMGSVFVCQLLARQAPSEALAPHWPALMAWLPVFVFGPVAVYLLDRVET